MFIVMQDFPEVDQLSDTQGLALIRRDHRVETQAPALFPDQCVQHLFRELRKRRDIDLTSFSSIYGI